MVKITWRYDAMRHVAGQPDRCFHLSERSGHTFQGCFFLSTLKSHFPFPWPPWESPNPESQQTPFIHFHLRLLCWTKSQGCCFLRYLAILLFMSRSLPSASLEWLLQSCPFQSSSNLSSLAYDLVSYSPEKIEVIEWELLHLSNPCCMPKCQLCCVILISALSLILLSFFLT